MKTLLAIAFCFSIIFNLGCPDRDLKVDSTITIVNLTDQDILHWDEYRDPSDTLLPEFSLYPTAENIENFLITKMDSVELSGGWKHLFKKLDDKVFMVYLFSRDSVEQLPWSAIRDKHIVLKRYNLTLDSLESRDWKIAFP